MCGIAGFISTNTSAKEKIEAAVDCLTHRGPEGKNTWASEDHSVALGHNRLRIIDTSDSASQPMQFMGSYTIIHNGEIYNYVELRKDLEGKGFLFKSSSDTEVIVAAYVAYGKACLQHFDGMFAFAIWDQKEKKLFAARDRFGEKPFYFFYDGKSFAFASEMKALWQMGLPREVNTAMLYNFLTIGYTSNPADPAETFYNHIHQLSPANFLLFDQHQNELRIEKYWQPNIEVNAGIKEEDAVQQFQFMLSESVRKRLRSDVPIGTSLSGGLDSSTIVAVCSQMTATQYSHKAFTAVFEGFEKNEEQYAAQVARRFNLEHYTISIKDNEVPGLMEKVMHHQEVPVSSGSVLAQYKVYEAAKKNNVTVLLDGQGADETLGGYHSYYKWYWQELYRQKQLLKSGELKRAKDLNVKQPFNYENKLAALFPEFAASMLQTRKAKLAQRHPYLDKDFVFSNKQNFYYSTPASFDLNGALFFSTFVYGLNELLHLADRNSMAHATEVRLPFLNHQLVEFLFTLPPYFKIRKGWTKWLLRITAEPLLPKEVVWRKDKVGFEPPQKRWMQNKEVQESVQEGRKILVDRNILHPKVLSKKIQPHDAHAADNFDWKTWAVSFLYK